MNGKVRRSSLGLILLSMLVEEPMHAYRMQKLINERGKDKVVNVRQRASVYQTLDRLLRLSLIEIAEKIQTGSHPDRIVYSITDRGRDMAKVWLCEMLTTFGADFPEFPAAVSVLTMLTPGDAQRQFEIRALTIQNELTKLEAEKRAAEELPRLFLLEDAYRTALLEAELTWLQGVIADLGSGSLAWDERWLREVAAKFSTNDKEVLHDNIHITQSSQR
ncbi:MAG TPA: PadR family transcriptional regulator [Bryobacteraceae bacterium]|nr:PadR family transcriptional regulator [Bryobacteraceae bacterium]